MNYVWLSVSFAAGILLASWVNSVVNYYLQLYYWERDAPARKAELAAAKAELDSFLSRLDSGAHELEADSREQVKKGWMN